MFSDCFLHGLEQRSQPGVHIAAKMNAKRAPSSIGQHLEIAACLGRFHDSECKFLSRDWQFDRIVTGHLEKHSRVWSTLVCLASGVQESWAETKTCGHAFLVTHDMPDVLQGVFVLGVHL